MENAENFQSPIKAGGDRILKFMQDFMKIPVQPTSESGKIGGFDSPFEGAEEISDSPFEEASTFTEETDPNDALSEKQLPSQKDTEDEDIFDLQETDDDGFSKNTFFEDSEEQGEQSMSTTFPWLDDEEESQADNLEDTVQNKETGDSLSLDTPNDLTEGLETVLGHLEAISQHFQELSSSLRDLVDALKKRT